ncbi:hypothetical protein [Aureimonas sp. AU12]|uniref:hypothetical protein n=1 Tax=Aureimonas sp. AU12 TaxID=1638161 RepID=UPI000784D7C2|nr:hypothetical protein [Aureimonas sp. AU12]
MLHVLSPSDYAAPDLTELAMGRWCGRVERFDPLGGIEGWALAIDAPAAATELELVVGDAALAIAETAYPHAAVDRQLGFETCAGFRFGPEIFARLARLGPHRSRLPVSVRIAGTPTRLRPPTGRDPAVCDLVEAWESAVLAGLFPPVEASTKGDRLLARLAGLRSEAEALRERALRPLSDNDVGQIDAVYPSTEGQLWFVGWIKRGVDPEFSAVIVDREKLPAGGAVMQYERPDLNSTCVGVVGLLDTGWTPPPVMRDGFVYLGRAAEFHLRYGAFTRLLRADAFLAAFAQAQPVAVGGHADALASVLQSGSNWIAGNAAAAGIAAEGGIDRLLMVPGFGCLAEGWAVSPAKRVETFHMKIGDCVLVADEAATSFRARPDLASVFGGGGGVTARAGFAAVLRGGLPANAAGAPLLRIVHDDGTSAVQRVEPKVLRRLDPVADSDEVLRLYPSLRFEPFYDAFLAAIRRNLAGASREPAALREAPAKQLVVLRLPAEPGNINLVFDRIARHLPDLGPGTGVAVVADQGRGRAEALLRFEELRAGTDAPLSLFAAHHPGDVLAELPALLARLGAERFVHVGRGVVLNARGWREAALSVARRGHGIERFEILDDAGHPDRVDGALGAACFGWSTAAFLAFTAATPPLTRGLFNDNGLPSAPGRDRVLRACAMRIERAVPSRLADMIDADLLAGRGGRPS